MAKHEMSECGGNSEKSITEKLVIAAEARTNCEVYEAKNGHVGEGKNQSQGLSSI